MQIVGRPTVAEIDLGAIAHNLRAIQARVAPARVMAVVKANAYGHGILDVAQTAVACGVSYLGVATLEEALQLRGNGFDLPVLVFGGFFAEQAEAFVEHGVTATVYDWPRAERLAKVALERGKKVPVHVKVDTGMGRVGVDWSQASAFVARLFELQGVEVEGVYSHFASSDATDKTYAKMQLRRFRQLLEDLQARKIVVPWRHMANSGAILDLPESYFDMVRAGVMLYGYYPSDETSESVALRPAMALKSQIIAVKEVQAGTAISYNSTYKTRERTRIAIVPVGYGDGYNRLLSNRGEALVRGRRVPVVGRVCMDQIMLDLGPEGEAAVGDEVVLLGRQGSDEITIYEWCEKLNTIPYEVTCLITGRVPRCYKQHTG